MKKLIFSDLVKSFEKLEKTTSHNQMVEILSKLLKGSSFRDIDIVCYFTLGGICAGYEKLKLGLGDQMVMAAMSLASGVKIGVVKEKMREFGDLGRVAGEIGRIEDEEIKKYLDLGEDLTVRDVYSGLLRIARATGSGSQEVKKKTLASMLSRGDKGERKYIARLAAGEMRLGIGEMTLLDALAVVFLGSKEKRSDLEHAYNVCSDIGHVAKILVRSGLKGIKGIRIALNRPMKPMLAQRVSRLSEIKEKIGSDEISAEEKHDGERIQTHKDGDEVKLFSRRLTDVTDQFPDVVNNVRKHVKAQKAVLDGEVVAYDFENDVFYPFQMLMQRRRKYEVEEYADKIPVKYMLFDILYLKGKSWIKRSYPKRREKLNEIVKKQKYIAVTDRRICTRLDEIEDFFQECINRGLEGMVCKSCADDSYYRAGARGWTWIKWKRSYTSELSDTLDLVVVGAFAGKGKRGGTYGALLCAAYDQGGDTFQTVCKLGTGFSDEELAKLPKKFDPLRRTERPARVMVTRDMRPDYWFDPAHVLEVRGSEITKSPIHTCGWDKKEGKGLALRFPRFERWRPEKSPEQATTVEEVIAMCLRSIRSSDNSIMNYAS